MRPDRQEAGFDTEVRLHPRVSAVRTLESDGAFFVYDTNTNAVVPASEGVCQLLRTCGDHAGEPTPQEVAGFTQSEAERASINGWLSAARRRGMLKPLVPKDYSWFAEFDPRVELSAGIRGLTLGLTERCNFRCAYCSYSGHYEGHRVHSPASMSWAVARKSLELFLPRAAPDGYVSFYGGEPTMEWDVLERAIRFVRTSRRPDMTLKVISNGSLLTPDVIDFFVSHDVGLTVSLDGPAWLHDDMRRFAGGDPTHEVIMEGLVRAKARCGGWYRRNVDFNCLLQAHTLEELKEVDTFFTASPPLSGMPVNALGLQNGMDGEHAAKQGLTERPPWTMVEVAELFLDRLAGDSNWKGLGLVGSMIEGLLGSVPERSVGPEADLIWPGAMCYPGKDRLYVDTEGRLYMCHNLDVDHGIIGDLDRGFDYDRIRSLVGGFVGYAQEACSSCWARRLCTICEVKGKRAGRISLEALASSCETERNRLVTRLETFLHVWRSEEELGLSEHPAGLHQRVRRLRD